MGGSKSLDFKSKSVRKVTYFQDFQAAWTRCLFLLPHTFTFLLKWPKLHYLSGEGGLLFSRGVLFTPSGYVMTKSHKLQAYFPISGPRTKNGEARPAQFKDQEPMTCEHPVQQFIAEDGRVHAWMPSKSYHQNSNAII